MPVQTNRASSSAIDVILIEVYLPVKGTKSKSSWRFTGRCLASKQRVADYLGYTPEEAIGQQIFMMHRQHEFGVVEKISNYASLREPVGAYNYFHNF
jgi:hypothetical protein